MFDLLELDPPSQSGSQKQPAAFTSADALLRWFTSALDEIDYGVIVVRERDVVAYANDAAKRQLAADHPLQLLGGRVRALHPEDVAPLGGALRDTAARGHRRLLHLGGANGLDVALVPLEQVADGNYITLMLLARKQMGCELSVQWFGRIHELTTAECCILQALCSGDEPQRIAANQGVAISTVRTQISSIRQKTGAPSIRVLLRQVALLPPLVGVLGRTVH